MTVNLSTSTRNRWRRTWRSRAAVAINRAHARPAKLEASGSVDLDRLRARLLFLLPERARSAFVATSRDVSTVFGGYIRGMVQVSLAYMVVAIVVLFAILVWRGVRAALGSRDVFGGYLAFGITTIFGVQALFNISVALGLLPALEKLGQEELMPNLAISLHAPTDAQRGTLAMAASRPGDSGGNKTHTRPPLAA